MKRPELYVTQTPIANAAGSKADKKRAGGGSYLQLPALLGPTVRSDGRRGVLNRLEKHPFQLSLGFGSGKSLAIDQMVDFFPRFIDGLLSFFETGTPSAPAGETLEIIAILEAGNEALANPGCWQPVGRI